MYEISVIIPLYNGCKFVDRCIKSVLNQKYKNVEILVIDDCSKDNSLEIVRKLSKIYTNIKIIMNKENLGVAKTRNKGMSLSKSTYLVFMDQDDYLEKGFLGKYIKEIKKGDFDAVYGGYKRIDSKGSTLKELEIGNSEYDKYLIPTGWGKIHKRDFLLKNNILFSDNIIGEDILFILSEISKSKKIKTIKDSSYVWYFNELSVSNSVQTNLDRNNSKHIIGLLKDINNIKNINKYFSLRTACFYLINGRNTIEYNYAQCYEELFNYLKNNNLLNINNIFLPPRNELLKVKLAVIFYYFIYKFRLVKIFTKIYVNKKLLDTKNENYAQALNKSQSGWKKYIDIQAPYRHKLQSLNLGKTLDIGCGTGRNLTNLSKDSIGIDHNKYSVKNINKLGLNAYTTDDFDKSNKDKFDSILIAHVLEHMPYEDARNLISKYMPRLEKNGRIVIVCPQIRGFKTGDTHIEFFDTNKIVKLLKSLGFNIVSKSSFPFPLMAGKIFKYNEYWVVAKK